MRWLSYRVFRALGWEFKGVIPDLPKMVIVGAPHTSNWDFFLFLAALHHFDLAVKYLAKDTLFRWPFGTLFRATGGIPVDRGGGGGMVTQVEQAFDSVDRMILVIAPEGTRKAAPSWKSGFLQIAERTGVPVVLAGLDYANRALTIGPKLEVGDDPRAFMDRVRAFYSDIHGLHREQQGPVRIHQEG